MSYDVVIVGAGHNGLTAAAYLARAGRSVLVLEASDHVGGATVSARAFPGVDAQLSRYSYLVSLLPRTILDDLGLDLELVRRRYSSYTPVPGNPSRGLLVDVHDAAHTASTFAAVARGAGSGEYDGWESFYARMARFAERVFPTVTSPLLSAQEMRERCGDPDLFDLLTSRPVGDVIRAAVADDVVRGVIATDALIGTFASVDSADLRQNICFLYHLIGGGTGDWDVPVGGMGALTSALTRAALDAGATIRTGARVTSLEPSTGAVTWEAVDAGSAGRAVGRQIAWAASPTALNAALVAGGAQPVPTETDVEGAQLKVNMLLTRLPRLVDGSVDPVAAFSGTFHINESLEQLEAAWQEAEAGRVPDPVPCEIYCHTLSDRSILGAELAASTAQTLTLFGLHLPARLFRDDNESARAEALDATLRSLNSVLAEPIQDVLALDANGDPCIEVRTPVDLETDVGLPGGNIFHRSLQWPWAQQESEVGTWGVETPYPTVFLAGAGARRGGGVSGIPGHNAAMAILAHP